MPSTPGMKFDGYYDQNCDVQFQSFLAFADWIDSAVECMSLPDETMPITVADYGCSEGRNSIVAVGRIIEALRRRRPNQFICGIHNDLPSNNFIQLFGNLHDATRSTYLQDHGKLKPNVAALATAGSFYGPLLPTRSVHFGLSVLAVEWLDHLPDVPVPDFIGYMGSTPAVFEAFASQAERDWIAFLQCRAQELVPGGKLLIVIPGSHEDHRCSDGLYDVLNDACLDQVKAGRIGQQGFERIVVPTYFRSCEEMLAPFRPGAVLEKVFTVDKIKGLDVPTPFVEDYRRTGNAGRFADEFTGFLRAFSEPVVARGLAGNRAVVDAIYDRVRERLAADPEKYMFHNIEIGMLLTRAAD